VAAAWVLQGLFLHLVRRGFPLTVQDYQDALRALQNGYGRFRRQDLHWLCETLWARSEEEIRYLSLLFRDFPWPLPEEIEVLTGSSPAALQPAGGSVTSRASSSGTVAAPLSQPVPVLEFAPPTQTGLGLPRAQVTALPAESFILTPHPPVSERSLIMIWRRFRLPLRTGPRVELDIAAAIQEQCRRGVLTEPVLIPRRHNQARLLVLVDASASMVPWRNFNEVLADSLQESGLASAVLYHFNNVPAEVVFARDTLNQPMPLDELLQQQAGGALLIISDAGAARGRDERERVEDIRAFLQRAGTWMAQPVAWVNPMPRPRWRHSSAHGISRLPNLAMFELSEDGLTQAVDVLRGQRSV
jgi:hypothetical protein